MFATKKDFALLARQVSMSSRDVSGKSTPILVDVYQVRLWKLMHTPDKADVDAIAQTFHVCVIDKLLTFRTTVRFSSSVIHKNYFIRLLLCMINVYRILAGRII